MPLHAARAAALLAWVNSTRACPDALTDVSQLQDCSVFIRIINRIHHSEEGDSVLEQPLQERINFIRGFLQKHCKHQWTAESLVSAQQLLDGEELTLAKVAVLLLYHTSMSCRSPGDWSEFDYKTQVELAAILKFVLDHEESLAENLESFLQRRALPPSPSSSSEEQSPLLSLPQKQGVRFLQLQRIASTSGTNNMLAAPPSSPMGDVLQTPQFQLRRLKKQLAVERENRDELEVELAENRKLITEKEAQITVMQQRIDRLALLHESQAAEQPEPRELEELREKNESLMLRLHEALKQCQDLKTEKGQMDRKINQLSEENGDLSFKLREIASHMVQLQDALNELSEEHNAALAQSQEKQGQLESDLHAAVQDKRCSEEKMEILQGKISLLEDQLAKLRESSTQEKGEVMGDILKLEELKQEVSNLSSKGAELQATVLRLEEEKQLQAAALLSDHARFQEEKQQLSSLITNLQNSLSENHQARERLEQDLQAQQAELGRLAALDTQREKILREKDSTLQQLQQLQETNVGLSKQLQGLIQARDEAQAASAEEKAELSRKIKELEAKILELSTQGEVEGLKAQLRELEGRLKENQQRLAEREKLAKENARLQERLLFLEESLRNTEGILEDEKRRAAESMECSLARIAQLEAERQQLAQGRDLTPQEPAESRVKAMGTPLSTQGEVGELEKLEEEMRALSREHSRACQQLQAEQEKAAALEARVGHLAAEHQERLAALQADLSSARARVKEKEGLEQDLRDEASSLREQMAVAEQTAAQRVAGLEAEALRASEVLEGVSQQLSQEKLKSKELESIVERLRDAEAELSRAAASGRQRELELEAEGKKLSGEVTVLNSKMEEILREHRRDVERWEEEAEGLKQELERVKADCVAQRSRKAELEAQLQNSLNEQRVERSMHKEELARTRGLMEEKEGELEELRRQNASRGEELRDLQKTVSKLRGELASGLKEEKELRGSSEPTRSGDVEGDGGNATSSKEMALKSKEQEPGWSRELYQEKLKEEAQALRSQVEKLEGRCREQQEAMATLERAAAEAPVAELEAARREAAQQKEKALELQKLLEASRSAQALHGATLEALRKELQEKGRELAQGKAAAAAAEKELAALRSAAQEKGRSEESWKEQVAQCVQELERKNSLIGSLEHEVSILHRQVTEKEGESKELKRLIVAESEKSKKLEERLRVLQTEMATAASRAAERCSLMKVEVQRCQEEMEKQRLAIEALKRDRHCQSEREDELCQEVKVCQDKCLQKEQLLAALQQELGSAQALAGELPALKHLCQQLQAERASLETQHRQDLEQGAKALARLHNELARVKLEATEVPSLRERVAEQDRAVQRLQAEAAEQAARLEGLEQANARLAEENRGLRESQSLGQQRLEAELGQAKEHHRKELEKLRSASQELLSGSRREAQEAARKLEALSREYESGKAAALQERRELLEDRQRLTAQVEELTKKLAQQEKTTRTHHQRVKALQEQLAQREQPDEACRGQLDFAQQQLQDMGKSPPVPDPPQNWDQLQQHPAELSTHSQGQPQPLHSTRKATRSHPEASAVPPGSEEPQGLPPQLESLESLYFTPSPNRSRAQLGPSPGGGSLGGGGELSLDSGCRTRSARRRTTIAITMSRGSSRRSPRAWGSKKQPQMEEPTDPEKGSATSNSSLTSFPSQDSLVKLETTSSIFSSSSFSSSSPQDPPNSALLALPGYRPVTRSSLRRGQADSTSSLGRGSIYLGSCQEEPEPLDDWSRIAELQQRNQACPPHLKTSYPLESRPSNSLVTITDEEMKTGDPKETLRRASVQPSQLTGVTGVTGVAAATRRSTLATILASSITTRQQRKRLSDESQHPDTPESKKPTSCFPRPQTPRERRSTQLSRRSEQPAPSRQAEKRQATAFSILNTPKKLGNSLLRRAAGRKGTPKNSPRASARRSPRIATAKSPKGKAGRRSLQDTKF
uniref:Nuclear mitotic apparatus protein 1 n=1 Tax=Hypotaenidia okinawae TaxID=2861861 RepID=A0A6G1REM4_9GRUI